MTPFPHPLQTAPRLLPYPWDSQYKSAGDGLKLVLKAERLLYSKPPAPSTNLVRSRIQPMEKLETAFPPFKVFIKSKCCFKIRFNWLDFGYFCLFHSSVSSTKLGVCVCFYVQFDIRSTIPNSMNILGFKRVLRQKNFMLVRPVPSWSISFLAQENACLIVNNLYKNSSVNHLGALVTNAPIGQQN